METNFETQEALIYNAKYQKCNKSLGLLLERFRPMLNKMENTSVKQFKNTPLEPDDIRSLLTKSFIETVNEFDEERGANFATYAKQYTDYKFKGYIRSFLHKNNQILNYCHQQIQDNEVASEDISINEQIHKDVDEIINLSSLTDKENLIVREHILGTKSINELSLMLNIPEKALYYMKKKAHKKLSKTAQSII